MVANETRLRAALEQIPDVVTAYLFGSQARGEAGAGSDVDIGVLLAEDPPATLAGLRTDIQEALERAASYPVDLVILNRAPVDLVHRVLRDGKILIDRFPEIRLRFEVRARNEYLDLLPILEEYRRPRPQTRP